MNIHPLSSNEMKEIIFRYGYSLHRIGEGERAENKDFHRRDEFNERGNNYSPTYFFNCYDDTLANILGWVLSNHRHA